MSLTLFLILLLLAVLSLVVSRPRAAFAAFALSFVFLLFVGQGWMPGLLLKDLQSTQPLVEPQWAERSAIVVLGMGVVKWPETLYTTSYPLGVSRVLEAGRLYYACKKAAKSCTVIASGGDPRGHGIAEAEVIKRELTGIGVDPADIEAESKSNNTFQNARFSSEILRSGGFERIVLVTSGVHLRRALLYFSHFKVAALGAPSDRLEAIPAIFPLAQNFAFNDYALHEYFGIARYGIYNLMGWNK